MKDMIIKGDWGSFLDLEVEELFFVKRQHPFVIVYPLFILLLLTVTFLTSAVFLYTRVFPSVAMLIISWLMIISISMTLTIYTYIYWYFHLYILTNRKILEVKYTPLFSHIVNDIFLDKVNCTEIDLDSRGFFNELIDMGDLTITFDRPTHEEEFVLHNIKGCDDLGKFLTQKLMIGSSPLQDSSVIWMRNKNNIVTKPAV